MAAAASSSHCPICKRPAFDRPDEASAAYRPFCSKRCADVDLARWLGGTYAIPAETPPDNWEEGESPEINGETGGETGH